MPSTHICTLEAKQLGDSCLPALEPTASVGDRAKRFWRSITLISMKNPRSKTFFRSQASVDYEKRRHLRLEKSVFIHPFSLFRSEKCKSQFEYICIHVSPQSK